MDEDKLATAAWFRLVMASRPVYRPGLLMINVASLPEEQRPARLKFLEALDQALRGYSDTDQKGDKDIRWLRHELGRILLDAGYLEMSSGFEAAGWLARQGWDLDRPQTSYQRGLIHEAIDELPWGDQVASRSLVYAHRQDLAGMKKPLLGIAIAICSLGAGAFFVRALFKDLGILSGVLWILLILAVVIGFAQLGFWLDQRRIRRRCVVLAAVLRRD